MRRPGSAERNEVFDHRMSADRWRGQALFGMVGKVSAHVLQVLQSKDTVS